MSTAGNQTFTISRVFEARRPVLFDCFTDARRMQRWWGPKGVTIVHATMDLRVGGIFHYGMKWPDGNLMWGRFVYLEIVAPERIVVINSFSDEKAGLKPAPFPGPWPQEMHSTFLFTEEDAGRTRFTVVWKPHNSTAEEQAVFAANHASMNGGWSGTMERLEEYLASGRSS